MTRTNSAQQQPYKTASPAEELAKCPDLVVNIGPQLVYRPLLVSTETAAAILGVSRTTVWQLLNAGELRKVRIGSRTLVATRDLEAFAERLMERAG